MKIEKSYEKYQGLYDFATEHDFGVLKSAGYGNYGGIESEYGIDGYEENETIN